MKIWFASFFLAQVCLPNTLEYVFFNIFYLFLCNQHRNTSCAHFHLFLSFSVKFHEMPTNNALGL